MSDYNFKFSDKLPWLSDAAIAIFPEAKLPRSGKMKKVIAAYRKGLVVLWQKCFSQEHVLSRSNIENKLTTLVKDFYNKVYNRVKRKASKTKRQTPKETVSMRVAISE